MNLELLCLQPTEEESVSKNRTNTARYRERNLSPGTFLRSRVQPPLHQPIPGLFPGRRQQKPFLLWPVWMEFSVPSIWRSPNYDIRQWVELFSSEGVPTEGRRTWDKKSHKCTSAQDSALPEVELYVIPCGDDNRHSIIILGLKRGQEARWQKEKGISNIYRLFPV